MNSKATIEESNQGGFRVKIPKKNKYCFKYFRLCRKRW